MTGHLGGHRALVTGGARGIGAAIVRRLAAEGAAVLIGDVRRDEGSEVAEGLTGAVDFCYLDVTDPGAWDRLVRDIADDPLSILINNAGGRLGGQRLHEVSLTQWERELRLNLTGAFLGMRGVIPSMVARGRGAIVNVTSISGIAGHPDAPAYQAAKAGLRMLTVNAAVTYAAHGIRVNAIAPGLIATPTAVDTARNRRFVEGTPLGHPGRPDDIAHLAAFLVSDEAAYVTGVEYVVDGGYTAV